MKKRLLLIGLSAALLLGLCACGAKAPESEPELPAATAEPVETAPVPAEPEPTATPAPAPTPEPISYEDAYLSFIAVYASLTDEVQRHVETHNAVLKSQYPESYYMHSDYLMQDYVPFLPAYPAAGSALRNGDLAAAEASLRQRWPDAELTNPAPGVFEARYTYIDKTSGQEVSRSGRCVWECDGATGALRVRAWIDDEITEFTEFIPQGSDTWLLYTMADKILVTYRDGEVTALWHAHRINEPAQSEFGGDVRFCSLEEDDFYPAGTASKEWITEDENAEYILTLQDGEMVYSGSVAQDVVDEHGAKIGVIWQKIEPIRLLK